MAPDETLAERFRAIGVNRDFLRRVARGPDTLFSPLTATRAAIYSDEPACIIVRAFFCGMPASADELRCSFGGAVPWSLLAEREPGLFVCPYHVHS